ncbi:MAG: 50S ribosomal protein L11 methyltransferase [Kiritimatiellae bacterium]|nr:50S ribosomal protein L11 methyltransferase [Kiritimatiellia bacterium]MCB1101209.1 50S ribosomal protein L11 methyltransferase [Kiritimatiellia bacterium]
MTSIPPPRQYWSITEGTFNCLIDHPRAAAFDRAIRSAVRPGDVVVDMGSGTGVLALFAARAGAARVYAVEHDPNNLATLSRVIEANGFADRIQVLEGDVCTLDLPEPVDVIVGEMIATGLIEEQHVRANNNMLRFARDNARVVLAGYTCLAGLVWSPTAYHGLTFDVVRYEYPELPELTSQPLTAEHAYARLNLTRRVEHFDVKVQFRLQATAGGVVNGLRIRGVMEFHDGTTLKATPACNYPIILPVPESSVRPGQAFRISLSYTLCGGFPTLTHRVATMCPGSLGAPSR